MILSKSAIAAYKNCPRKYKFSWVDKIKAEKSEAMQTGIDFHEVVEGFWAYWSHNRGEMIERTKPYNMNNTGIKGVFTKVVADIIKGEHIDSDDIRYLADNFALNEARRFATIQKAGKDPIEYFLPLLSEKRFKSEKYQLSGVVDAVFRETNDEYLVFELKTGRHPKMSPELRRELVYYALMVNESRLLDKEIRLMGAYFPRSNKAFVEKIGKAAITRALKTRQEVDDKIQLGEFPCKVSKLCLYCEYSDLCEMGGERVYE